MAHNGQYGPIWGRMSPAGASPERRGAARAPTERQNPPEKSHPFFTCIFVSKTLSFVKYDGFWMNSCHFWEVPWEVNASAVKVSSISAIWTQNVKFLCKEPAFGTNLWQFVYTPYCRFFWLNVIGVVGNMFYAFPTSMQKTHVHAEGLAFWFYKAFFGQIRVRTCRGLS